MGFTEKLAMCARTHRSMLCIGLDPDPDRIPLGNIASFNEAIIDATKDLVCSYKPNFAFYEQLGREGGVVLERTLRAVPTHVPVIGDAKRGDIGSSSAAYAKALFDVWGVDAVTVSPYLGYDGIEPFLKYEEKAVFILCRTSNPGARDFQDLLVKDRGLGEARLYELVAQRAMEWNRAGNVGLVVGATYVDELEAVRRICPTSPILIPGVGAQGGDLRGAVEKGVDVNGRGAIVNASREVLYASSEPGTFASAARSAAARLRDVMNDTLAAIGKGW